ncbi:MAG TPA: hypothetical protein VH597_08635 [Verrucomicrobiae bacterium]|jgi:WD40 repeat protein|nr:hypothetical protein [Verrucomicrobiae bacterium]
MFGVQSQSFSSDGHRLSMMNYFGEIVSLDLATEKIISSFPTDELKPSQAGNFCVSPDDSKIACGTSSLQGVEIRDPKTGRLLYSLPDEAGTIYWLAWSPDNHRLAVARDDGSIGIWNLDTVDQILAKLGLNP